MIVVLRRLLVRPYLPKRMQLTAVAPYSGSILDQSHNPQLNEAIAATKFITDMIEMSEQNEILEDNDQNISNKLIKDL